MKNIINWFFGSFFRTLGRVLVYLLFGFLLSILLRNLDILPSDFSFLLSNVKAQVVVKLQDETLTNNNFVTISSGSKTFNIHDDKVYGSYGSGDFPPSYYIGTFCSDTERVSSWQGTSMNAQGLQGNTYSNTLKQLYFYDTKYKCMFPNSNYSGGHIVYIYGAIEPIWSTSGTTATLMGRIVFTSPNTASWSLLSWSWSNQEISVDFASDTLISQNTSIINQNTTIINQNNNIKSSIESEGEATRNTLKDDSIDESGTNTFVSGLDGDYSSLTPFTDFINLPLTWIQTLLASDQTCNDIELPLPFVDQNLTLPCMTDFWNSMGVLGTLIQLVWIAVVGVRIFNGLFLLTCDTLDPNPDKDMTRLRTWEL